MAEKSSFWSEFKTFIARGNVMDMAVGVVVGGAFTAIVNSLVGDIINPLIGKLFGGVPEKSVVWMSHTDFVSKLPEGFTVKATSADCPCAAPTSRKPCAATSPSAPYATSAPKRWRKS